MRPGRPNVSGDDSEGSGPVLGGSGSPGGASEGSQESSPTPRDGSGGSGDPSQTPRDGQEGSGDPPPQDPSQTPGDGSEGSEEVSQTPSDYWERSPDPMSADFGSSHLCVSFGTSTYIVGPRGRRSLLDEVVR